MPRQLRDQSAGMYHVVTQAVADTWLFYEDADYEFRLAQLAGAVREGRMRLHMYCLMGNHEHLLISTGAEQLSRLMFELNRGYAVHFNRVHIRRGRLYGRRFEAKSVASERYLLVLVSYLALNPERASFERAETYRWSSYPALIGRRESDWFIDQAPLLDAVGGGESARRLLALHVDDGRLRRRAA